jgi:hypothetical protein
MDFYLHMRVVNEIKGLVNRGLVVLELENRNVLRNPFVPLIYYVNTPPTNHMNLMSEIISTVDHSHFENDFGSSYMSRSDNAKIDDNVDLMYAGLGSYNRLLPNGTTIEVFFDTKTGEYSFPEDIDIYA